jgi:hypothetical protein
MVRTSFFGLLLLAALQGALADDAATMPASSAALAANTSATTQALDATKRRAQKPSAASRTSDAKSDAGAQANEAAPPGGDVKMSGMSILGNEDAPKSLVIVPWKSSQLADMPSVSRLLDSATQPVDKDVFMRELSYYEFKSGSK